MTKERRALRFLLYGMRTIGELTGVELSLSEG